MLYKLLFSDMFDIFMTGDKKAMREDGLNPVLPQDQTDGEDSMNVDLPMMPLKTILQTTCNFSDEYKLLMMS